MNVEVDATHDPAQPALSIPAAVEAKVLRVAPRHVLGVPQECGDPCLPIGTSLVESDAIAGEEAVVDAGDGARGLAGQAGIELVGRRLGVHAGSLARG